MYDVILQILLKVKRFPFSSGKSLMDLRSVQRTPLVAVVVEKLRKLIESGGLKSGDRLPPEPELVTQLGVSRTVLREAIIRLQTVGLVNIKRGVGTYVADQSDVTACVQLVRSVMALSTDELIRFVELRDAIESHAARLAANLVTETDVAEFESLCNALEDSRHDLDQAMKIDLQFHLRLVEITGNRLMRDILVILREFIREGIYRTTPAPIQRMLSRKCHMPIVDALRNHDSEAAEAAVHNHMHLLIRRLQERDKQDAC
jgi:GntR family transcriptional regulator, transcriptional repressor for pyruvate dehydrogenase complex